MIEMAGGVGLSHTGGTHRWVVVLGLLAVAWSPTVGVAAETAEDQRSSLPVFEGTHDVNTVNLFVSVVGGDGLPVAGLTAEDFTVIEDGEEREVTNFRAVERVEGQPSTTVTVATSDPAGADEPEAAANQQQTYVAILVDAQSLQGRNRRRVLEGLGEFVRESAARDDQVLVAANTGRLEILRNFSTYEASVMASIGRAAELPTSGESSKAVKRHLKRTIFQTDLYRMQRTVSGMSFDYEWSRSQGQLLINQINLVRWQEHRRIKQSLQVADQLLQSMAGLQGRKVVIWLGEDLAVRPAIDIYSAFYRMSKTLSGVLNIVRPEIWGEEVSLRTEFHALAARAQACNASLYIVDASDRDREVSSIDFRPPSVDSIVASEAGGEPWSPGIDFTEVRSLTEGSEMVALATGGASYSVGRNVTAAINDIDQHVASYYSIAYRRPGPPDGRQHSVKVRVNRAGVRVRHHEKVLDRTAPQRLVDLVMSRVRLDAGDNPLGLTIGLGGHEETDDERVIQTVSLGLPVENLVLLPDEEGRYRGQILVAVVVIDDDGNTAAPQLLRLTLDLRSEQLGPDVVAQQSIRLLMNPDTQRIAVGVRDLVSGLESSNALVLGGGGLG